MRIWIIFAMIRSLSVSANEIDRLPQKLLKIGEHHLTVEVATTPEQLQKGLMFRSSLGKDEGMLFVFDSEQVLSFWMKNTLIPLSIAFFDKEKRLIEIIDEMEPARSLMQRDFPRYQSKSPAKYALEVNQGWFRQKGIKKQEGLTFSLEEVKTKMNFQFEERSVER